MVTTYSKVLPNGAIAKMMVYKDPIGMPVNYYTEDAPLNLDSQITPEYSLTYTSLYLLPQLRAKFLCIRGKHGVMECMEYSSPNAPPVFYKTYTPIQYNTRGEGFALPVQEYFGILDDVEKGVKDYVVAPVTSAFNTVEDKVKEAVKIVAEPIKSAAGSVISGIKTAGDKVAEFTTKTIPNTATSIANTVAGYAEDAFTTVKGEVVGLVDKVKDLDIPGKFMSVVNKVKDVGESVGTTVYKGMGTGFEYVKDGATMAFEKVKDGVLDAKDYVVKYGKLVGENVYSIAKKIGEGFYDVGKTLATQGQKIATKIVGEAGPIINTAKDTVTGIAKVIEWIGDKLYKFFDFLSSKKGLFIFKAFFVLLVVLTPLVLWGTFKGIKKAITGKGSVTAKMLEKTK